MANIKSQIKRNRQTIKRQARNKAVRSELRTRTKRAISAIEEGAEDSEETLRLAIKRIDKAAAKGVIHKNQAANRKSRLMKRAGSGRPRLNRHRRYGLRAGPVGFYRVIRTWRSRRAGRSGSRGWSR